MARTVTEHSHGCVRLGCKANVPCTEQHQKDGDAGVYVVTTQPRCEIHVVKVRGVFACPSCDGTGTFAKQDLGRVLGVEWVPCWFCGGTGDQREMPPEWRGSPQRNVSAYASEASRGR